MLCVILLSKYIIKFSTVIGLPFDETTASVGLLTVIYCHDTTVSRANFHAGKTRLTLLNLSEYVGLNVKMYSLSLYRYYDEKCSFCPSSYINLHCVKSVQMRSFFWSVFSFIQTV